MLRTLIESVFCEKKHLHKDTYKIYNASAGSGKTYTVTKAYLKIILSANSNTSFRNILAITFTNKAVNEMKNRILDSLHQFAKFQGNENSLPMFLDILHELKLDAADLQKRARLALKYILHNYAFFDISTIDKFTHRVIRTFAKDLKIPQNFEVVLDTDLLLEEAIAKLIYKVGEDEQLTKVLLEFAYEKIDDDKSWDITFDLTKIGGLLFDENHTAHLKNIEHKTIDDFLDLRKDLKKQIQAAKKKIVASAHEILDIIAANGLQQSDFRSGWFPKFILKISTGQFTIDFTAAWKQNFETEPLYTKACPQEIKEVIDSLHPRFNILFNTIKFQAHELFFLKNTYQNIVPLTVLNAIQREVGILEKEQDLLPISSFNRLISEEIKNQPAPFIYERLGEKYRHYFIDEFQDTSVTQWNNLVPLVANALESLDEQGHKGSLTLVGDAKQSIYRWRGGKAEQFIHLTEGIINPFVVEPTVTSLPSNYRSGREIVRFNNDFFTEVSSFLQKESYNKLYVEGNRQATDAEQDGYVQLQFIEAQEDKTDNELYCTKVLEAISYATAKGYNLHDICILTRKKKHGILIADYLVHNNMPIISSETLLLNSSPKIIFLVNIIRYCLDPLDNETAFAILSFLSADEENAHSFINAHLHSLTEYLGATYDFHMQMLHRSSIYDGLETAITKFQLIKESDAYITFFMDTVLEVEQKEGGSPQSFLRYWEKKKDRLSITAPDSIDAVRIMTIHKSKGLEFPIVIFPFANSYIYEEIDPKLWIPVEEKHFNGFNEVLISKKKEVLSYNFPVGEKKYRNEEFKLELDAFNLLYVALTRAVKGLFIISKKDVTSKGQYKPMYYSGLFIHYLQKIGTWNTSILTYSFGDLPICAIPKETKTTSEIIGYGYSHKNRPSFTILSKSGVLWNTERADAIQEGNLLHHIMSYIKTGKDVQGAFEIVLARGEMALAEVDGYKRKVLAILNHPKLQKYYQEGNIIKNEVDIITENGLILRPDRIVITKQLATIIDYKTGKEQKAYHRQLHQYALALEDMGFSIEQKIIVYSNKDLTLEFI